MAAADAALRRVRDPFGQAVLAKGDDAHRAFGDAQAVVIAAGRVDDNVGDNVGENMKLGHAGLLPVYNEAMMPTTQPVMSEAMTPAKSERMPRQVISLRRSGHRVPSPAMSIPKLPKLAKLHMV